MKATLRIAALCLMVCSSLWLNSAHADPGAPSPTPDPVSDGEAGRVVLDNTVGVAGTNNPAFGPLLHVDGVFGDSQGWDGNLFRVESFIPMHLDPGRNLIFLSLQGMSDEDGNGMGNFGVGYRVYSPTLNRVFTIAGWLDIDDGHSKTYYRGGVTIESLGQNLDFILNGYSIIKEDSNVIATGTSGVPIFVGNNVLVSRFRTIESAYSGGDVSIGTPVPLLGRWGTKIYGGAHYLTSPGRKDALGGDLRVHQRLNDDVTIDLVYSWDNVFKSNAFVNVGMTMPTGKRDGWMKRWMKQRPVRQRLADRIHRNRRIPTSRQTKLLAPELALDPRDGLPLTVYYINDTGAVGGTGTVESPASSFVPFEGLSAAARNSFDIVQVSGAAFATNGTLQVGPGQRLLSTAISQTVATNLGTLALPGGPTGVFPVITNGLGGNVLGLSSGSEISGFVVDGSGTGRPIVGDSIAGFNVNNNILRNSFDHGMVLTNATGTVAGGNPGIITMNTFSGNPSDGMQIINNAVGGGTLDLLLTMNTATNNGPLVGGTGIRLEAHNGNVINADPSVVAGTGLNGNIATNNGTGIKLVTTTMGVINASLDGNTITGNTAVNTGLSLNSDGAGSSIVISSMMNNVITGNNGYGINGAATGGGSVVINRMFGNVVSGNIIGNLRLSATGAGSTINAGIGAPGTVANDFSGSTTGSGIELVSTNGNMFVAIQNNVIATAASPNATFGILGTIDGGVASITIGGGPGAGNNIVSNNTGMNSGIAMVFSNTAGTPFTPQLNTGSNFISQIGGAGISVTNQSPNTKLTITSTGDMILDSATNGLVVANNASNINGEVALFVDGGTYNDSDAGDGIRLIANNSGTVSANINNITANNNGSFAGPGNGLRFDINNTSTANLNVTNSTFMGNDHNVGVGTRTSGDGIQINLNRNDVESARLNSAVIGTAGNGNNLSSNDGDGLEINQNSTGIVTSIVVAGNVINLNGQRGIFYDSQMTALTTITPFTGTFTGNSVQNNAQQGFSADIRGFFGERTVPGIINITGNNNFSFNGRDGISIVTDTDRVRPTTLNVNAVTFNHGGGAVIPHDPNAAAFAAQLTAAGGYFKDNPNGRYLSTLTDINVAVTVTDTEIIGNGTAGIVGANTGMSTLVGTDTYVRLDFQRNRAESNNGSDFRAGSFLSGGATPTTTINAGIDTLTLDGTAQLDMRFLGNRLNTIDVGSTNAFQTNADQGKNFVGPNPWTFAGDSATNRPVFFYRVDQSGSLNSTNVIINGGVPTNATAAFGTGRFNLDPGMVFGSAGFATDQPLP